MVMLSAGILLWAVVHLIPGPGQTIRQKVIAGIGEKPYKAAFSLALFLALALIILGWRSAPLVPVYVPPGWGGIAAILLMPIAVFLFAASHARTRLKRYIRHPQLSAVVAWSVAHLLANGDTRSLLLFGGLGAWALLEIAVINSREGPWVRPLAPPVANEVRLLVIAIVVFAVLVFLHPKFAGVAALQL
ncbi:MAG TPA: NnrU family protein [Woeseiaceae bacterium]|nr:NnrU family protein [Woeseiaceae bacterium]